jgi:glycosyltransferase involved in cell wall biosynthesis
VHHNVESRLLARRAAAERSPALRGYLALQAALTCREEARWCERVRLNVAVSAPDRDELRAIAPGGRFVVVPNGVDTREFQPAEGDGRTLAFVGGTEWPPNVQAMEFFCREVLPRLRERGDAPRVVWVGRASPEERRRYEQAYGVELTGYVDDVRPHLGGAACAIVPLRVGGGTRLKITTAWAMGKAVVSTSVGCEGLDARHGENILVADTPEEMAAAVHRVLHDGDLRARLERGARRTAEEVYDWEVIGREMVRAYRELADSPAEPRGAVAAAAP